MWSDHGRLVFVLAASLLLNVFLGGILVGRGFAVHRPPPRPPQQNGALVPAANVGALPEDQRKLFQSVMRTHRDALRSARLAHKAARDKIEADIAAPTYNKAVISADFDALHQTNRDLDAVSGEALTEALAGLSAASRAALVAHEKAPQPEPPKP
ncbi:protein of unknown function [Beijerinckiaceae bacterium RH CH11]|jgi:uncharacterized membrane protein|nr:periplasmic heavy metal sensor [Beijerinckiaceae bacterium]VVB44945.1 protein of unknown function [Beijerinckiaceae bacterium RH CH11]VVB45024.1 protein of unknown function [Beijerinckiaceae bacterium RH AL8]